MIQDQTTGRPLRRTYYTSEDYSRQRRHSAPGAAATWSVYSELWTEESYAEGEPIDGSQQFICSARDEATADHIANALFHYETAQAES